MAYSIAKSLFKNSAMMMVAQAATWVSGLVLLMFVARYLGSAAYGRLYLAMSIQTICQWIIDYGGQNYIPKEVSRIGKEAHDLMSQSIILRVGLWLLSMIVVYVLCIVAHYTFDEVVLITVLGFSNLWVNLALLLRSGFQGLEDMKYPSIGTVLDRSVLTLTVVPALIFGLREIAVAILMALTPLLNFYICWRYSRVSFLRKIRLNTDRLKLLLKDGLPYFLWSLFGVIYYRINAVMLSLMTPQAVIGWYGAAFRFFGILMFIPAIYSAALYPILTRLSQSKSGSMLATTEKSLKFLLLAGIPIAVGLLLFSRTIIQILFGLKEFGPSAILLQIFSLGMLLTYIDFVLGGAVLALDKQKQWAFIAFGAMVINIALNYLLIPHFQKSAGNGGIGAAIATDLTELFVMVSAIRLLPNKMFSKDLVTVTMKGAAAGLAMAISVVGAEAAGITVYLQPVIGLGVYVLSLFATATFRPAEVRYLLNSLAYPSMTKIFSVIRRASA